MKTIIAGSRDYSGSFAEIQEMVEDSGLFITVVICGGARGVDAFGRGWALSKGITVRTFPALWDKHGKAAGSIRNQEMADYADALIAILTHPDSRGTLDMIRRSRAKGIPVHVYECFDTV